MSCLVTLEEVLVRNPAGTSSTGTARAHIRGLSSLLHLGVYLVYQTQTKTRPSSFGANTFSIYGWQRSKAGEWIAVAVDPVNNGGSGSQAAPGGWEGTTTLQGLELVHTYAGLTDAGQWSVLVVLEPIPGVSDELFRRLAGGVSIAVPTVAVTS